MIQKLITQIGAHDATRITVIQKGGKVIADSHEETLNLSQDHWKRPEIQNALNARYGEALRLSDSTDTKMFYLAKAILRNGKPVGAVRLSIPMSLFKKQIHDLNMAILWICFFGISVMLMTSNHLIRRLTKPITELMGICNAMMRGNYTQKVHSPGKDEIGRLGYTLNRLSEEISAKIETISLERAQLTSMLKAMNAGIVSVDGHDEILFCNHTAKRFFGGENSQMKDSGSLLTNGFTSLEPILSRARKNMSLVVKELSIDQPQGRKILNLHASPFPLGDDIGVVLVIHDMTRIRHLEKVRQDFVANVSHEIKTPLTSINGYVETLLEGAIDDKRYNQRFLEKIKSNANRLIFLVKDILSLAKIESDKLELSLQSQDWQVIISRQLAQYDQLIADKNLSIDYRATEPIIVHGDHECMRQILDNLISNALRYTPAGGSICITTSKHENSGILSVSDTGIGIPKKDMERVFERFYRVDKDRSRELGGTGLGLSIVKNLASSMGGTVSVSSVLGEGSTFAVSLPISQESFNPSR